MGSARSRIPFLRVRSDTQPLGAYGLALEGLSGASRLLVPVEPDWPTLSIVRATALAEDDPPPARTALRPTPTGFELRLASGGTVRIDQAPLRATFFVSRALGDEEIVHPYLGIVAALVGHWLSRESFHSGAFVSDGGAWGILGDREAGKSSTLAALALRSVPIVCDDVLVLSGGVAYAGPRSIDLRKEPSELLGAGDPLGVVGARERWRLILDPVPSSLPFRGWILLSWGPQVEVRALSGAERLGCLTRQLMVEMAPAEPHGLLELAALPVYELLRPKSWDSLDPALDALLAATG